MQFNLIPKAEIHVHLEGTAHPDLVRRIATAKGQSLPEELFREDGHYNWADFVEFLTRYDQASSVFTTRQDYRDLTYDYLKRCAAEGTIYAELIASPDHGAANGLSLDEMIGGIEAGIRQAEQEFGIITRITNTCVRHYGVASCEKVAQETADYVRRNPQTLITGFNISGDEGQFAVKDFKRTFEIAHKAGLKCTAHAGEATGPETVWQTLKYLPVSRIGHGVRSIEDPALVKELAKRGIPLEVCPSSNVATGVFKTYAAHPLRQLRDAGVKVTINSDDPPYFFTSIGREYRLAKQHFGYTDAMLVEDTKTAIEHGFVADDIKRNLLKKCDQALVALNGPVPSL